MQKRQKLIGYLSSNCVMLTRTFPSPLENGSWLPRRLLFPVAGMANAAQLVPGMEPCEPNLERTNAISRAAPPLFPLKLPKSREGTSPTLSSSRAARQPGLTVSPFPTCETPGR